ncbi:MAG TPA: hypothetical protein VER17_03745 [Tepidisphaeraceae bacterium]|nr:hypothetical protein [Tepidisphaeraceae bacterium]
MIEELETRRLMASGTAVFTVGSTLVVYGGKGDDLITVRENNQSVRVDYTDRNGVVHNGMAEPAFTGITQIKILGNGGNDDIYYTGNSVGADIHGDGAAGGTGGSDDADWRSGKKRSGGTGGGTDGGAGNGADFISVADEGFGASTLDGDGGDDDLIVQVGNMTGKVTVVYGGNGNDVIDINQGASIFASPDDARTLVYAEAGRDTIVVHEGKNTINGGAGNDVVVEYGGNNTVTSATVTTI